MAVVKLWCALVGMKSPVFSITVDLDEDVNDLKEAIKGSAPDETAWCSAKDLQLFVAKCTTNSDGSSEWMKVNCATEDALGKGLMSDEMRATVSGEDMWPTKTLQRAMLGRYNLPLPSRSELHVLVLVPKPMSTTATALGKRKLSEVRDVIGSPSLFAQCEGHGGCVKRLKKLDGQIECHREMERSGGDVDDDRDLTPLPLVLLNEMFARFGGNCRHIAFGNGDDIYDPLLSISAIMNLDGEGVICEPLAASFPLLFFDNEWLMTGLIRVCASLKAAVHELMTKRSGELAARQLDAFALDRSRFLYKDFVEINGTTAKLQHVSRLERYVFVAKDDLSGNKAVVKFAKRCGQRVHGFCVGERFVPDVLHYEVLPCGWSFIVMEKLNLVPLTQAAAASGSDGSSRSSPVQQQLVEIKNALEAASFVHGDLWGSNVLWGPEKKRMVLIDFDWAGETALTTAETGKPLRAAHDAFFVDAILAKLETKKGAFIAEE